MDVDWIPEITIGCRKCGAEPWQQCRGVWAVLFGQSHTERIIDANVQREGDDE